MKCSTNLSLEDDKLMALVCGVVAPNATLLLWKNLIVDHGGLTSDTGGDLFVDCAVSCI